MNMFKRVLVGLFVFMLLVLHYDVAQEQSFLDVTIYENVEALASQSHPVKSYCYGSGNVFCERYNVMVSWVSSSEE